MKRFLLKILVYTIVVILIEIPVEVFKIHHYQSSFTNVEGSEVYIAIGQSKSKKKIKKLVLGDSVGRQLYPCEKDYDNIVSLACNRGITMAGQYFLLKKFLETNNSCLPEEVILLITPFSLSNDVDQYSYQYFLKPFPLYSYSKLYTDHLKQRVHSIPLYWSANLPFIQSSSYTPRWAVPSQQTTNTVSPVSYEYLMKIDSITKKNNINFRMVSTPIRDDRQNDIDSFWEDLPTEYMLQLSELLQPYKESVVYLPYEWYSDAVHFGEGKVPNDYLNVLLK